MDGDVQRELGRLGGELRALAERTDRGFQNQREDIRTLEKRLSQHIENDHSHLRRNGKTRTRQGLEYGGIVAVAAGVMELINFLQSVVG